MWWPKIRNIKGRITPITTTKALIFAFRILLVKIRFLGATPERMSNNQRALKLNRHTILGSRNDIVYIEEDDVIYKSIRLHGVWGDTESRFLATLGGSDTVLLDLGANIGSVTRQALNMNSKIPKVIVVEPRKATMINLKNNLTNFSNDKTTEIIFCEFALDKMSGKNFLYTETNNIGNSSLLESLVPSPDKEEIITMSGEDFYKNYLTSGAAYILKSDLQGMDARILNSFPDDFWNRVKGAVIEVWPNGLVQNQEVEELIYKFNSRFEFSFDWNFSEIIEVRQLIGYWGDDSQKAKNLFIRSKA